MYDGDGNRVKGTVGGVTTLYIGNYFEWTSNGNTKYYYHGALRLAMRRTGYASGNGLVLLLAVWTGLAACGEGGGPSAPGPSPLPPTQPPGASTPTYTAPPQTGTPVSSPAGSPGPSPTVTLCTPTGTKTITPTNTRTLAPSMTPSPTPRPSGVKIEHINLSAYYTTLETEYSGPRVPVLANDTQRTKTGGTYLMDNSSIYTNYLSSAQYARSDFLYHKEGLCMQGSGKLESGRYLSCTDPVDNITGFEWHTTIFNVIALETAAKSIFGGPFLIGDVVEIPELKEYMLGIGKDEFFTITDVGGGLGERPGHRETLDIYIGEGWVRNRIHYEEIRKQNDITVYVHR